MHGKSLHRVRRSGGGGGIRLRLGIVAAAALATTTAPDARADVLIPTNVVANSYHQPFGGSELDRGYAFNVATDGPFTFFQSGSFDTFSFNPADQAASGTDFAGLIYSGPGKGAVLFDSIGMRLGRQYNDGGSFNTIPKLYLLTTNADPDRTHPEAVGSGYVQIVGASLTSPVSPNFDEPPENPSGTDGNPTDDSPIIFDLTGLPAVLRTGYGWAIGGVSGDGGVHFISVSEMSATGSVPEPAVLGFAGVMAVVLAGRRRSARACGAGPE